jgi:hypothetical protein
MTRVLGCLAAGWYILAAAAHGAELHTVPHELWDRPRSAAAILAQPAVKQALAQYLAQSGSRLVIHHALGQEPLMYAEELKVWLMSLAVEGARIGLSSDLRHNEPLRIEVVK